MQIEPGNLYEVKKGLNTNMRPVIWSDAQTIGKTFNDGDIVLLLGITNKFWANVVGPEGTRGEVDTAFLKEIG